jgi:ABC-2 type transport system ATP-binding protein
MPQGWDSPLIKVQDLTKDFRQHRQHTGVRGAFASLFSRSSDTLRAVDHVSFTIQPGEFVGFIGPNGAGKSTTIKMLAGILHPTSGEVWVDGLAPQHNRKANARRIGALFGQRSQLWWDLPVPDTYNLLRYLYQVPKGEFAERVRMLKDLLGMDEFWDQPVRQLSLGQRMRGELGAALLHRPKILYLDEPTIGMDALVKERIRQFLMEMNRREGATVLLTTHDLQEIEQTCPRVMVINQGKLLYDGSMRGLRERCTAHSRLVVDFYTLPPEEDLGTFAVASRDGNRVSFAFQRNHDSARDLVEAIITRYSVRDIAIQEPSIEAVVKDLFGQRPGDAEAVMA